jgi:hypothetical protein
MESPFPVLIHPDCTTWAIKLTDGVNVCDKLFCVRELPYHLDLKILLRVGNLNSVVLGKRSSRCTMDRPADPGFPFFVFEGSIAERAPLPIECCATIVTAKISLQRLLEAAATNYRRPGFLLSPASK